MRGDVDLSLILWYNYVVKKVTENAKIPTKPSHIVREVLLYVSVPVLLTAASFFPTFALIILPAVLPLLYVLYRRFGPYLSLSCIVVYGAVALALDYNILTVIYSVALLFGFCGLVIGMQFRPSQHLLAAAAIVCFCAIGAFVGVGIVRGAEGMPIGDIAAKYMLSEKSDPVISFFARDHYDNEKPTPGEVKLKPTDDGYKDAVAKSFSEWAKDEFNEYTWYYCIHYGAVLGFVGFFAALYINEKVNGKGNAEMFARMSDMRLPRAFLWTMALPATITGILLGVVGGYDALSATVMHTFCTIPAAFGCYTLLGFIAALFNGKARVVAYVVLTTIGIAAVLFPFTVFILSVFGVCDCILNLRFWISYLKSP